MARDSLSSRVMARDSLSSRVQLDTCNLPNNFCTACMHPFFSKSDQEAQGKPIEVCLHSFVGVIHSWQRICTTWIICMMQMAILLYQEGKKQHRIFTKSSGPCHGLIFFTQKHALRCTISPDGNNGSR